MASHNPVHIIYNFLREYVNLTATHTITHNDGTLMIGNGRGRRFLEYIDDFMFLLLASYRQRGLSVLSKDNLQ
jgi:hypothetical protein